MPDDPLDEYLDPPVKPRNPRERVHSIASRVGIPRDLADDYLKVTQVESSHNINVRDSAKGAKGFGQVMPDVKGGTTRTVGGRRYNLKDVDQNIEAGIRYFAEGGGDPVARRLHYFGGPRARQQYEKTGRIPRISDGNMTAEQYVKATGGRRQQPTDDLGSYLDPLDEYLTKPAEAKPAADPLDEYLKKPSISAGTRPQPSPFAGVRAGARGQKQPSDPFALLKSINAQPVPSSPDDPLREQAMKNVTSFTLDPIANVRSAVGMARRGRQQQVDVEAEEEFERLKAAEARAKTPEMTAIRKEYGRMPAIPTPAGVPVQSRAIAQPLARTAGGLLKLAGGVVRLGGIVPRGVLPRSVDEFSDWANKRGQIVEEAASLPPLTEAGEEIKRQLPEKVQAALADTGLGIAEIVFLKKATGMPLGRLLALETAAKTTDEPLDKRASKVAESYAMGRVLQGHLSRPASAALFGAPTAAREGQQYLQGGASLEDAILNTAVQTGVGAALGGKPRARQAEAQREDMAQAFGSETARGEGRATILPVALDVGEPKLERPQEFYHKDWGNVVKAEDQTGARRGRTKVFEKDNPERIHYPKTADLSGSGNIRMVPIKSEPKPEAEIEPYLDPAEAAPTEPAAGKPLVSSEAEAVARPQPLAPMEYDGKTYTRNERGEWQREDGRVVKGIVEQKLNELSQKGEQRATETTVAPVAKEPTRSSGEGAGEGQLRIPPAPSSTAAKREKATADRAERNLPPIPKPERKADADLLDAAKAANRADPTRPLRLAEEVLQTRRALSDKETVQLDLRRQQLKNEYDRALKDIADSIDPEVIKRRGAEADSIESEAQRIEEAWAASGTEKGRSLRAQRIEIDQDFRLLTMVGKLTKDKGRKLNAEERARVEEQHKQIEELTRKLAEAEERAAAAQLQKQIDKVVRRGRRAETKATLDEEFADLKAQFAQARKEAPRVQASGLAGLDPEGKLTILIGKMARNRVKAGTVQAEALVDEIHSFISEHIPELTKRDVRDAISGYGLEPRGDRRSEAAKQLAAIRSELKQLSTMEDVAAGKRLSRADKVRQTTLLKQEAELQRRMAEKDYSEPPKRTPPQYTRETYEIQKRLEAVKQQYAKDRYKATRSTGGKISDELAKAAGVPKTIKSIGDISAVLRQGGFYAVTHPIKGGVVPVKAMLQSFTDMGYRNVEAGIKNHPKFEQAKKDGIEFTGVDKNDPNLSKHEEGYLGKEYLQYVPGLKQVANFSERTFVSFLDAQRMSMYDTMTDGLTNPSMISRLLGARSGLSSEQLAKDRKRIAKAINVGTGRGDVPRFLGGGKGRVPTVLNVAMFSPRLVASRLQLLNAMFNPVAIARMPRNARAEIIKDNVKFLAATMAMIQLAKAAGATVSLDPDDPEFLKIRYGDTVYDQLTGLQQPLRYVINMARGLSPVNSKTLQAGSEMYSGEDIGRMTGRFARSKANPALSPFINRLVGEDYMGRKFSWAREAKEMVFPLPAKDVYEAMEQEGLIGVPKALPTFVGIGVGSYPPSPDRPTTHAEKLARKIVRNKMPDEAREEEEMEADRGVAQARAKSRRGRDVGADIAELRGKVTPRQIQKILSARNRHRLTEDVEKFGIKDMVLVYQVASDAERKRLLPQLYSKIPLYYALLPREQQAVRERLNSFGIKVAAPRASQ